MFNNGMRQNVPFDGDIDININNANTNTNTNANQNTNFNMNMNANDGFVMGEMSQPIIEPGRERCVQRNIYHEVRHVCPINTKIINNHIYRHTYQPRYTCSEENIITNQQCGSCCNFR